MDPPNHLYNLRFIYYCDMFDGSLLYYTISFFIVENSALRCFLLR
jgi:hypothetical protein